MKIIQDECVSVSMYASMIGKSNRTVQRYISEGLPIIKGTHNPIHIPTANEWWLSRIQSFSEKDNFND